MRTTFARVEVAAGMLDLLYVEELRERFAPHTHDSYAIGTFVRGSYRLRIGGVEQVTAPGTVVALAPGEIHSGVPLGDEGWYTRMFYPDARLFSAMLGIGGDTDVVHVTFRQPLIEDPGLARNLFLAHQAFMAGQCLEGEERLLSSLATLVRQHGIASSRRQPRRTAHSASMTVVRDYIHANVTAPIRLTTLAELAGVSSFHLIRLFGREYGVSPYAYVKQLRVARAQQLLRDGASATEAAFAAGFSDQSHLNRAFKNMLGVTPGVFARTVGARTSDAAVG